MKQLIISIFLLSFLNTNAQTALEKGIGLLEKGNYAGAVKVLEGVAIDSPEDKTAWICYGRALGLSGEANQALNVFNSIASYYPNDYEIELNEAEAYMWLNDYNTAKKKYSEIIASQNVDFKALWGMANACFSLQDYASAYIYIEQAINDKPSLAAINESKKFILLGLAQNRRDLKKYDEAEDYYNIILTDFPDDRNTLINKAILHILRSEIGKAKSHYQILLDREIDKTEALAGLSYCAMLTGRKKQALTFAQEAVKNAQQTNADTATIARVMSLNLDCLLLNEEISQAEFLLDSIDRTNIMDELPFGLANVKTLMAKRQYAQAEGAFEMLLEKYPDSYDLQMVYSELMRIVKKDKKALNALKKAIEIQPFSVDAKHVQSLLISKRSSELNSSISIFGDNAGSQGYEYSLGYQFKQIGKWQAFLNVKSRELSSPAAGSQASLRSLVAGTNLQLSQDLSLQFSTGLNSVKSLKDGSSSKNTAFSILLNKKIKGKHDIGLQFKTAYQDYNAQLLSQRILDNILTVNTNIKLYDKVYWYTNMSNSFQSDGNIRSSVYSVVYWNIFTVPLIQAGFGTSLLKFKNAENPFYFSPEKYRAHEVHLLASSLGQQKKKLRYEIFAAWGIQKINADTQSSKRMHAVIAYAPSKKLELQARVDYNNTQQPLTNSYAFNQVSFKLRYSFN